MSPPFPYPRHAAPGSKVSCISLATPPSLTSQRPSPHAHVRSVSLPCPHPRHATPGSKVSCVSLTTSPSFTSQCPLRHAPTVCPRHVHCMSLPCPHLCREKADLP